MKKSVLLTIVFLSIIICAQFLLAASNSSTNITVDNAQDDDSKVNLAYSCLDKKISDKTCDKLSLTEKIFSVIATGRCASELMKESKDDKCWPKGGCQVKETAQAMIALDRVGYDTAKVKAWILTQNQSTSELQWFLQIDGTESTSCSIKYSDSDNTINLNEDKTLSSGAGSCLSLDYGNYWLSIAQDCYPETFEVKCEKGFQTNLIYKKSSSSVFYVSEKTTSGVASQTTEEKVYSQCFAKDSECDFESTLWAVYALDLINDYDISPFWPYLQTVAEDNEQILSEGILSVISESAPLKETLLKKQQSDGYWDESGDKFYDTALALMPFANDFSEKTKAKKWLLTNGVQGKDGCWEGNFVNTAFLLYSIWPKLVSAEKDSTRPDCLDAKNFCLTTSACKEAGGSLLSEYSCAVGTTKCCSKNLVLKTCKEQSGEICNSNQMCQGGIEEEASGITSGETCCVGGTCTEIPQATECETNYGTCLSSCGSTQERANYACETSSQVCCVKVSAKPTTPSTAWIWIVLMLLLIVLVVLAIIYRDKLRPYWLQISSKFNKGGAQQIRRGPQMPPSMPSSSLPVRTPLTRRVIPGQSPTPQNRPISPQSNPQQRTPQRNVSQPNEMDEVLKKLKDMSK